MTEGTKSIIYGCHSPIHSILVYISWIKLYRKLPSFKETICIAIHDIGHFGLNYLSSLEEKNKHWILGSKIANFLFGEYYKDLIARHSYDKESTLYRADKYSFYIAPKIWHYWVAFSEPKIRKGKTCRKAVEDFISCVKQSIESGKYTDTHEFYLNQKEVNKQ